MKTKLFEVRDRATFIPVFAILMEPTNNYQGYLLRRSGYGPGINLVMVGRCGSGPAHYDPYRQENGARTMRVAHQYIMENFHELNDGDVIDVEFILGESKEKKISERFQPLI